MNQKKIYICSPFSHWFFLVRWWRFYKVCKKAAQLMDMGYIVFSPIAHSFPISFFTKADQCDSEYWLKQDLALMLIFDEIWVYKLRGWEKSVGIQGEIDMAERLGKPVVYTI